MRALAATALAMAAAAGCSGSDGSQSAGAAPYDACVSGLLGADRSACVECLRSTCPSGLDALETGCAEMLGCVCPAGETGGAAARVRGCAIAEQTPSCQQGSASYSTGICAACDVACGEYGATSSSGSGATGGTSSSSGVDSNGSSGTGSGGTGSSGVGSSGTGSSGYGSSSGNTSGSGSGSGSGSSSSGSSCEDLTGCDTQCSSNSWQCSNGPGQFCMSSQCMCWDTCYFTVGSQVFPCASCDDYADCESAAIAACQ